MNINDAFPSKFIKADDLGQARIPLTVMTVTMEDIGDKEFKPVLRFMGKDKGMILNKTNAGLLAATWGDETSQWQGQALELFAAPVMYQGRQVMGLSVAPKLRAAPAAAPANTAAAQTIADLANDIANAEMAGNGGFVDDIPF